MKEKILQNTNRKNLLQLIWMRCLAIFGQVATILIVNFFLEIPLPLFQMFGVLACLTFLNCLSFYRYKSRKNISDGSLFLELIFDVTALALQLYFSGGAANPFISLFLPQVIIAIILLRQIYAYFITAITIACYVALSFHYQHLHAFHHHETSGDSFNLHLQGMLIGYVIAAILLLIFVGKIIKNLNEKNRLVEMGLMASSAAHELSTPLSTISVILSDWKKMNLATDLLQDVGVVESQLGRCKKIISEILSNSGDQRAQQAKVVLAKEAFDGLIEEWRALRNPSNLIYNFSGDAKKPIIFYDILSQAFFNIFDNALEASAGYVCVDVKIEDLAIIVSVEDRGAGFNQQILQQIGKPNVSSKNSSGVGLFLAISTFEKLGGSLQINNNSQLGAKIEIKIPS